MRFAVPLAVLAFVSYTQTARAWEPSSFEFAKGLPLPASGFGVTAAPRFQFGGPLPNIVSVGGTAGVVARLFNENGFGFDAGPMAFPSTFRNIGRRAFGDVAESTCYEELRVGEGNGSMKFHHVISLVSLTASLGFIGCTAQTQPDDIYTCENPDPDHKDADGNPDPCHERDPKPKGCEAQCADVSLVWPVVPVALWMGDEARVPSCPPSLPVSDFIGGAAAADDEGARRCRDRLGASAATSLPPVDSPNSA